MACNSCKTKPVFTLVSGKKLCKNCFIRYFQKKVRKNVRQYGLIEKKDRIAVALSGGKDSTVVLEMLNQLRSDCPYFELFAILIDEGIKGYRHVTVRAARSYCRKNNIDLHIYSFREHFGFTLDQMIKKLKLGPCTVCGALRRYLLNKAARELKATKIVTGHNCDDEAQSVVMNLFRNNNSSSARLGVVTGVKKDKRFIPRIKPLYFMLEKEIMAYAYTKGLLDKFVECRYAGEAYRSEVRDMLNTFEERHPGTKNAILASFLDTLPLLKKKYGTSEEIAYCKACQEPAAKEVCKACTLLKQLNGQKSAKSI